MPSLLTPLASLKGIGPALTKKFAQLGLQTLEDVLWHLPVRHEDWRQQRSIAELRSGEDATLLVTIEAIMTRRAWRRRMTITEARVSDKSQDGLTIVWFNLPYLAKTLRVGDRIYVSGTVTTKNERLQIVNPAFERPSADPTHATLVPIYRSVDGLSQRQIRSVVKTAVELVNVLADPLPLTIRREYHLLDEAEALRLVHFPTTPEQLTQALRRFKFEELMGWQMEMLATGNAWQGRTARSIPFPEQEVRRFVQALPFTLTDDQRVSAWKIFQDLTQPTAMTRLLQGDVGSGKTVVAALATFAAVRAHTQTAWLAPTVVLAEQHFATLTALFTSEEVTIGCYTGSSARVNTAAGELSRETFLRAVAEGEISVVVGTHALLHETVTWSALGLVVVDEQQRFGVRHRQALLELQQRSGQPIPHYLSLTATPIPRTMALWLSGELEVSRLAHRPTDRANITSHVVGPEDRKILTTAIVDAVQRHERVFVVTPTILDSDALGVRSATSEYERLTKEFPRLKIGLLHGSLREDEKIHVLEHFRDGKYDLVVTTTVIEVGIDIPEATVMIIEGAERFGLAQLHQLRGRIGRSNRPSQCYFVTDRPDQKILERLQFVAKTTDGLALAERDLQERGGGEVYGLRQSGLPSWQIATLHDADILPLAKAAAESLLAAGRKPEEFRFSQQAATTHRE